MRSATEARPVRAADLFGRLPEAIMAAAACGGITPDDLAAAIAAPPEHVRGRVAALLDAGVLARTGGLVALDLDGLRAACARALPYAYPAGGRSGPDWSRLIFSTNASTSSATFPWSTE